MNLRTILIVLVGIVAGYLAYATLNRSDKPQTADAVELEFAAAPEFTSTTLDGNKLSLDSLAGDVVLVNFWATWCAPCRIEMPMLKQLQSEFKEDGLSIVGVSVDEGDTEIVVDYANEFQFNYPVLHDKGTMARDYSAEYAVPTTVVIDRSGRVRHRIIGLVEEEVLRTIVLELLREPV
ncbi:MAG: TlpA family protein disulfide reductase [Rhodothermales bacterium]|nr:TlpA family protein disulfide reductase [Rhodothermales bacterium]